MKTQDMELLVRVADTGSMTRAARQLHLTPAAVSATIRRLEAELGVRLFERTTRSLHQTNEGAVVVEGCREVLARWRRTLDDARDHRAELAGTVHLAAPTDTSVQVLAPLLADLGERHPGLRVVMSASDSVQHLHREAIDLAVRYGALDDSRLHARKLAEVPLVLVAAPTYLAQHGRPTALQALAEHRCLTLHTADIPQTRWQLEQSGERTVVAVNSPLCGDGLLARQWAVAGKGIALKSIIDVVDDLEARRLVRVLPQVSGGLGAIHAVSPSRRFRPARVRAISDELARVFAERAERCRRWLAGAGDRAEA